MVIPEIGIYYSPLVVTYPGKEHCTGGWAGGGVSKEKKKIKKDVIL